MREADRDDYDNYADAEVIKISRLFSFEQNSRTKMTNKYSYIIDDDKKILRYKTLLNTTCLISFYEYT